MLKQAYHLELLKMITGDNAAFFEDYFTNELSKFIPVDRDVSYHKISDSNDAGLRSLFPDDAFSWPVFPTFSCEINYKKSDKKDI